jgi:hypothetical protein
VSLRFGLVLALAALAATPACGGAVERPGTVAVGGPGLWLVDAGGSRAPFPDADARVRAAQLALDREVGRPFGVAVDAALTATKADARTLQAAESLEGLAIGWSQMSRTDAKLAMWSRSRVEGFRAAYDPVKGEGVRFDRGIVVVTWRKPPTNGWGIDSETLIDSLIRARGLEIEARLGGRPTSSLTPDDLEAYATFALHSGKQFEEDPDRDSLGVLRLTALAPTVVGTPLGHRVESELALRASVFTREAFQKGRAQWSQVQKDALREYARWMSARLLVTSEDIQHQVIATLVRDGGPAELDPSPTALAWHRAVVARTNLTPVTERLDGGKEPCRIERRKANLESVGDCSPIHYVYGALLQSETGRSALIQDLVRAPRAETLAPLIVGDADLRIVLEALEPSPATLRVVLKLVAAEASSVRVRDRTLAAVRGLWFRAPALRPTVLFAIVALEAGNGRRIVEELAKSVDAELLTAFVAESPVAVELAPRLWASLGHVDAKLELVAPALDGWLRSPRISESHRSQVVGEYVDAVCTSRDREGNRVLSVLLRKHGPSTAENVERLERCRM